MQANERLSRGKKKKKYSTVERNVSFVVVGEPAFKRELSFLALRNLLNARLRREASDAAGRSVGWLVGCLFSDAVTRIPYHDIYMYFSFLTFFLSRDKSTEYKRASEFTPVLNLSFIDLKKTFTLLFLDTNMQIPTSQLSNCFPLNIHSKKIKMYPEDN